MNSESTTWKKLEPYSGKVHHGCLNCGGTDEVAPLDMIVAVGFGSACVTKDAQEVWSESGAEEQDFYELSHFEALAAADPEHDWQVSIQGPLRGRTYQRHGAGHWVLVDSNEGFA